MALSTGTQLGPYEILAPIGAGGMGEVYRARDSKLGREVAIKVLPEEFTQHPQKLARFEREARLLAALNHPGIATLYGVEEAEYQPFLVMELVEGETLADRIARGAVPVEEALQISQQIAEALEAAHEKGVIHRDLKPANIKVDPEGKVKVLDFGLAKAFADEVPESELSQSPTLSRDATRAGVILGTAAYMSPEQAKGKTVDKRSDIFSFGIVLYEMLTAKKAFAGEDVPEVLASIINKAPDWKALPSDLDPRIGRFLSRCLRKDRKKRLQAIGDVRVEIEDILSEPTAATTQQPVAVSAASRVRERLAWGLAILVVALVTAITVWSLVRPRPPLPTRFAIAIPASDQLTLTGGVALAPSGGELVYVANRDGVLQLHRRSMNELEAVPIRGTEGGTYPFFSPDGEWVGFFADQKLKKVPLAGGPSVTLCDAGFRGGGSWGPDDVIVFASSASPSLMQVSASGGVPELVTGLEAEETARWPDVLPGGHAVLFSRSALRSGLGNLQNAAIAVQSLESGERQVLVVDGAYPRYAPTGHIVFWREDSLWAIPFDSERLEVTGEPTPVLEGVQGGRDGGANFALAGDGSLVYVPSGAQASRTLVWVDRYGREEVLAAEPRAYVYPRISPDGSQVALDVRDQDGDIWIWDFARESLRRFTFDPRDDNFPTWTPDGRRLAFGSLRAGSSNLFWKAADGTGEIERLTESENNQFPHAFSPDGKQLVYWEIHLSYDLVLRSMDGDGSSQPLLVTEFNELSAEISPDGRWLAYRSDASGQYEIYVRPFPNVDEGRWQISTGGGTEPLWARDGSELFYLDQARQLIAVSVRMDPKFDFGKPEVVLKESSPRFPGAGGRTYDVSPDGERFLVIRESGAGDGTPPAEPIVVLNWFEELKRLVPTE